MEEKTETSQDKENLEESKNEINNSINFKKKTKKF